jgi:purine-nucleoside phosphorylase
MVDLHPDALSAARIVADRASLKPCLAIVCGSGLASIVDDMDVDVVVPYADLPGFPVPSVNKHGSDLVIGLLNNAPIAVLTGREHFYEAGNAAAMQVPVQTMKALGVDGLVLTNAAGSVDPANPPGTLMMLSDHINFTGRNPLIGASGDERFVDLSQVYDLSFQDGLRAAAAATGVTLAEGVYMWFSGPTFETPAEIKAARVMGADAVGMSTVPEALLARHVGLRVGAVSTLTNMAAGMSGAVLSHEETFTVAGQVVGKLRSLLANFAATYHQSDRP